MKSSKTAKRFLAIALAFVMAVTTALFEPVKVRAMESDPGEGGLKLLVKMTSSLPRVTWNSGTGKNAKFTIPVNIRKEGFTKGVKLGEFYASTKPFTTPDEAKAIVTPRTDVDTLPLTNEDGSTTFIFGGMPDMNGGTMYWMNEDEVKDAASKARSNMNQVLFAGKDLGHVAFEKSGNNTQVANTLNAKIERLMEKVNTAFTKMNPGEYNGPDVVVDDYDFEGAKKALDEVKPILTEIMEYAKTVSGVTEEDITKMNGFLNDANDAIETAKASIDATAALLPQEGSTVYVGASVFVPGDDGNDVEVLIGTLPVTYGKTTDEESVAEKPKHKLTVQYICKDQISSGVKIPDEYSEEVEEGKEYSVETPVLIGLTPSQTVVQGTMGTEDVTVVIIYTVDKCNVSFETNGGTEIEDQLVNKGAKATKPEDPEKEGYSFVNWYADEELTEVFDFGSPINANTTVYAKWEEEKQETEVDKIFGDVVNGAWYVRFIQFAYDNGLMKGKTADSFGPNESITRAEFVQVLYNNEKKPDVEFEEKFGDVKQGKWFASAILWASKNDMIVGYGNGNFGVNDNITREQIAVILYKYAAFKGYKLDKDETLLAQFEDADKIHSWAKDAMAWAVTNNVIKGKGSNKVDPRGNATRAETATMLSNFVQNVASAEVE